MSKQISEYDDILNELSQDGEIEMLDSDEDFEIMEKMNERMDEAKREYQAKEKNSQLAAANIILR
jgi:hypothetical protein